MSDTAQGHAQYRPMVMLFVAIILTAIAWGVWNYFNAPEKLIEKEFSTLTPDVMSKKTFGELRKLNEQLYEYKKLVNTGFAREWDDEEFSFYKTNLQRVNSAYVDKIRANSLEIKELLSFASDKLCYSISEMKCFVNSDYWNDLSESQQKIIVQAFQYYFDNTEDKHDKGMLALLLGSANYTGSGFLSKDYYAAITYFATAWKLGADGAAYCLYRTYGSFDRENNSDNMYLWGLRSPKYIDVSDVEKDLSAEKIKKIQVLARDPSVLNVGNSQ